MGQEVEKFDPATLMDGVKNRVKTTFVALIPDDKWEQMVQQASESFFAKKKVNKGTSYSPEWVEAPSEFEEVVLKVLREECQEQLKAILKKPEYEIEKIWATNPLSGQHGQQIILSEHFDNMIKEKMPEMMMAMMKDIMGQAFHDFFININNRLQQAGMRMS